MSLLEELRGGELHAGLAGALVHCPLQVGSVNNPDALPDDECDWRPSGGASPSFTVTSRGQPSVVVVSDDQPSVHPFHPLSIPAPSASRRSAGASPRGQDKQPFTFSHTPAVILEFPIHQA